MTTGNVVDDPERVVTLVGQYLNAGDYRRAEQLARPALATHPDHVGLRLALARSLLGLEDNLAAAHAAYGVLTGAPDNMTAMRVYALALSAIGWRDQAQYIAWRAVTGDPYEPASHYVYAVVLHNAGHDEVALTAVTEALRLAAADPVDYLLLQGRILRRMGRQRESTTAYERVLQLDPANGFAVHNIAVNRMDKGRWARALGGLLTAARMDPQIGGVVRSNIAKGLRGPLRIASLLAVALMVLPIVIHEHQANGHNVTGLRLLLFAGVALVFGYLYWLYRRLPVASWRSALAARPFYVVRLVVVGAALVVAMVAALDVHGYPQVQAAVIIGLFCSAGVIFLGQLAGL